MHEPRAAAPPTFETHGGIGRVRLNRPKQHNRLEPGDIAALSAILDQVAGDASVRVLVLESQGKSFCAGYDLSDLASAGGAAPGDGGIGMFAEVVDRLEACRPPTICAVQGPVYGGGTDLALACDFRIGVEGIRMFMPAATFGLHYYGGGLRRYVTRLGLGAAKRLFLLGQTIEAAEMLRIAYLDELLPDETALRARVDAVAATLLGAASADVLNSMKRALNRIAAADVDPTEADAAWTASRRSPEVAAAVAARLAERKRAGTRSRRG